MTSDGLTYAGRLSDFASGTCHRVRAGDRTLVLIRNGDAVYALDNRCPHMGFPLDRGSVDDGILTCHWHHARFDISTGGTFDLWADDVPAFPTQVIDDDVWIDLRNGRDEAAHHRRRLRDGLEQNLSLVIAKAAVSLVEGGADPREPFRIGLEFGTHYQRDGWGQGLTVLTCMMNLLPHLPREQHARANGQTSAKESLKRLPDLLNRQQQVDEAARLIVDYRASDAPVADLLEAVGGGLLREDRNFHTIQAVEASITHAELSDDPADATLALVAGARYLAAHAPTVRAQGQTFQIAQRLQRGERLFEEAPA